MPSGVGVRLPPPALSWVPGRPPHGAAASLVGVGLLGAQVHGGRRALWMTTRRMPTGARNSRGAGRYLCSRTGERREWPHGVHHGLMSASPPWFRRAGRVPGSRWCSTRRPPRTPAWRPGPSSPSAGRLLGRVGRAPSPGRAGRRGERSALAQRGGTSTATQTSAHGEPHEATPAARRSEGHRVPALRARRWHARDGGHERTRSRCRAPRLKVWDSLLCGRGESNPHARRHQILSLAWLPLHHSRSVPESRSSPRGCP